MSLIAMINIFLNTQLLQKQHTTNTQQNLLLQTVFPIATIKSMGNGLVKVGVHLVICIEQVKLHTTNIHTPHISMNLIVGIGNINNHGVSILIKLTLNRQRTKILSFVVSNLLTIHA